MRSAVQEKLKQQAFRNGEIHDWYRLILGYSDHLVADILSDFELGPGAMVLDPFSGSGTTAVECKKRGIQCWAVDANPSSCFATRVKTNWSPKAGDLISASVSVAEAYSAIRTKVSELRTDKTYRYLKESGMLARGWIDENKLLDVVAIKTAIAALDESKAVISALRLALMRELVHSASNVRFGPELYCSTTKPGVVVVSEFLGQVATMENDLAKTRDLPAGTAKVIFGDARTITSKSLGLGRRRFDAVITSPPYPTEHDYTRNTRLELAFLEAVDGVGSLQRIKKKMIRSHTKGVYRSDADNKEVARLTRVQNLTKRIEAKAAGKKYGFARLYGKVTGEYFGGMRRHFRAVHKLLKPGGKCAYVVGDQSSYFQIRIKTASILSDLARLEGFQVTDTYIWRRRWSTGTKRLISEHVLVLRKKT